MKSVVAALASLALAAGCAAPPAPSPGPKSSVESAPLSTPSPTAAPSAKIARLYKVDGRDTWISCEGEGSPTLIFEAGLGAGASAWTTVANRLASTTQVCTYD